MKVPIPDDWDGVSWCEYGICWPDSEAWRSILRGFITTPMRGRYWDERTGSLVDVLEIGKQIWLDNIPLEEVIMSCSTGAELALALMEVANAIRASQCCTGGGTIVIGGTGTGGAGVVAEEPSSIDDSNQTGPPPEGFDTWAEFSANKCNAASYLLDEWQADIARAQNVNFVATLLMPALLKILAVTILSPIPGDELVVLAGMIIIALQQGILDPALDAMAGALTSRHDDLLCALYEGSTVTVARSSAQAIFEEEYAVLDAPTALVANSLTGNWLNVDNLNRLFEINTEINYPTANCESCGADPCGQFEIIGDYGEIVAINDLGDGFFEVDVATDYWSQYNRGELKFKVSGPGCCFWICTAEIIVGSSSAYGAWYKRCDDTTNTLGLWDIVGTNDTGWYKEWEVWGGDANAFTVRFTVYSIETDGSAQGPTCPE